MYSTCCKEPVIDGICMGCGEKAEEYVPELDEGSEE